MKQITILIPTYNRSTALAATLTSLTAQKCKDFDVVISDQGEEKALHNPTIQTALRILESHGSKVTYLQNKHNKGMAEQRQFLLDRSNSPYSLFLDDDLILEPYVTDLLLRTIQQKKCGFVGNSAIGLSYINDVRPEQQNIEFWKDTVQPEKIKPNTPAWERYQLHNAANPYHIAKKYNITIENPSIYKVAWIGGCVLYDTEKLKSVGGFSFWKDLPPHHAGEDVLAQLKVMEKYGGCGVLPSGVYHQELPTTIKDRSVDAPKALPI